jgi:hypothetical protein
LKIGGCTYFNDCYVIFLQLGEREGGLGLWAKAVLAAFERAIRCNLFCLKGRQKRISTSIPQLFIGISFFSFYCEID